MHHCLALLLAIPPLRQPKHFLSWRRNLQITLGRGSKWALTVFAGFNQFLLLLGPDSYEVLAQPAGVGDIDLTAVEKVVAARQFLLMDWRAFCLSGEESSQA